MKLLNIRLIQEPSNSFIFYKENKPFSQWHYHPEYELVLITKGRGRRVVGDHIDRFEPNDLVLVGANTPHEWACDAEFHSESSDLFKGEGIVVQFVYDFLGQTFMEMPENRNLKSLLNLSTRGLEFHGKTKNQIISIMKDMAVMTQEERLYALFAIFNIFLRSPNYSILSSPHYLSSISVDSTHSMQRALKYILQNFQNNISLKDLLNETNMSNTTFCAAFKQTYRMTFKEYLLNIRIGYACKLLVEGVHNISEIAFMSGFENISNFNRQFKKLKNITPTQFVEKVKTGHSME